MLFFLGYGWCLQAGIDVVSEIVQSPSQVKPYIYPCQDFAFTKKDFAKANSFFAKEYRVKDKLKDKTYYRYFHQGKREEG